MKILIVNNTPIPAKDYGGTERIIWWLGKELSRMGHCVVYLVGSGSFCPFADVLTYDPSQPLNEQIPDDVDLVHLHFQTKELIKKPYLITHHGNAHSEQTFDINTVFVSRNQANRNHSQRFVHNGIDPEEYGPVDFDKSNRKYLLFLAWASRPEKNLKACLHIARKTGNVLAVMGGKGKWFKRRPWVNYYGFIGGQQKNQILRQGKALLFPVLWYEPCAVSIFESLYFGCPVFGTRHGCLPELVSEDLGYLSNCRSELVDAVRNIDQYNPQQIHDYAREYMSAKRMTLKYLELYEKVMRGEELNPVPPQNGGNFSRKELLPFYK